jgi:CHAD domain-containing protein
MHYQLGPKESVDDAFHRIGREVVARVRAGSAAADVSGIHEARRGCKWLRAMLRLLRNGLDADAASTEVRRIRRLAHLLGGARDAAIRLIAFRSLSLEGFEGLERRLEKEAEAEQSHHLGLDGKRKIHQAIDAVEKGWVELQLKSGGWPQVDQGIERSYRRARKSFRSLRQNPPNEELHSWRKRVKDLMYHVRLLEEIRPRKMHRLERKLSDLGDWLGYDRDLIILTAFVRKGRQLSKADRATLYKEVRNRRKEHLTAARHVAEIVFQDKPTEFTQKLERWWDRWRGSLSSF